MGLSQLHTLFNRGNLEEALNHLEDIEDHYHQDHPDFFEVKLLKARIFLDLGKYEEGEKLLNSLLDLGRKRGNLIRLDMVILLSDFLWRKGKWDQAYLMIEMGEYDFTKLGSNYSNEEKDQRYADLKRLKGIYYRYTGELDLAIEYFQECLYTAEKTNDTRLLAKIFNLLGLVYQEVGEITKAWTYFTKAYQMRKELEDAVGSAICQYNIASLQEYMGDMESARSNYEEAFNTAKEKKNLRLAANAMSSLGILHIKIGNFNQGMKLVINGLAEKSELGNDIDTSRTFFNLLKVLLNSDHSRLAPIFMDGMKEIYERNTQNPLIVQHFKLIEATMCKNAEKTIERAKAQQDFNTISKGNMIDLRLTVYAMTSYCDMLLDELKSYPVQEILDEIIVHLRKLDNLAEEQYATPLMIEISLLKAKFDILKLNYKDSLNLINSILDIIEKQRLHYLEHRTSQLYNQVLRKIENMTAYQNDEISKFSIVEETENEEKVAKLISENTKTISQNDHEGILFIFTNEDRNILGKIVLNQENLPNETMIHQMLSSLNKILKSNIPINTPIERVKHGEYHLISRQLDDYTCHYVYKGEASIHDISKLDEIIHQFNDEDNLMEKLAVQETNNELYTLIKETFNHV